jgi:hypothetical protein
MLALRHKDNVNIGGVFTKMIYQTIVRFSAGAASNEPQCPTDVP